MVRIDRVITRGGDKGETSLGDGSRVPKDALRVEAYGEVDEACPAYIAQLPVGYQASMNGAATKAVSAGPKADHRGTFLFAVADQKAWFDQLLLACCPEE